jgi:hypothetical protein
MRRWRYLRITFFLLSFSTLAYFDKTITLVTILGVFAVFDCSFLHHLLGEVYKTAVILVCVVMEPAFNRYHLLFLSLLVLRSFLFVGTLLDLRIWDYWRVHSFQLSIVFCQQRRFPGWLLSFCLLGLVDLYVGRLDFGFRIDLLHRNCKQNLEKLRLCCEFTRLWFIVSDLWDLLRILGTSRPTHLLNDPRKYYHPESELVYHVVERNETFNQITLQIKVRTLTASIE